LLENVAANAGVPVIARIPIIRGTTDKNIKMRFII
jgi:hypothetical protein